MTYEFDPELAPMLALLPDQSSGNRSLTEVREQLAEYTANAGEIDLSGVRIRELSVAGPADAPDIALRTITPDARRSSGAVYYIHGGRYTVGFASMRDDANVVLARNLGVVVIAVEYRLAPENPFPAGLEETAMPDCCGSRRTLTHWASIRKTLRFKEIAQAADCVPPSPC
ncbi:alpha/beta hydrolase [Nocardia sp. NBC_01327]|uniref:alpha/beta hydrolase n=1 Tax=Nocardia sp. NBC_01327 TaxID=2903593 RepID=UPI002E0FF913|nr:alpha/beta hydrolase fold domain-containing protein [Nocardia sp. NBC_01327]